MALRRILRIDDPNDNKVLKSRSHPVKLPNPALRALAEDMFETMEAANGAGLAAPQIGLLQRMAVIGFGQKTATLPDGSEVVTRPAAHYVLINPQIVKASPVKEKIMDGCLSLPGWYGEVERATWVTVDYLDLDGRPQRIRKATGMLSWALQHEIDHLNGVLFTEHLRDLSTLKFYGTEEDA
ncbi:peptide deformylase [Chloroflexia bacterium SDU3-3]|nr:peptide deformylase [Chloroflexia bacterium SDU3-3]